MDKSINFTEKLRQFYDKNNISVGRFACKHQDECKKASFPRKLFNGAEVHVGTHYGKVVGSNLDY